MTREFLAPDILGLLAVLLLTLASVADALRLLQVQGKWGLLANIPRLGAIFVLVLALAWSSAAHSRSLPTFIVIHPLDAQQIALALALTTLGIYLLLVWWLKTDAAALIVNLVTLALVVAGILASETGALAMACEQRAVSFQGQWILFLAGDGGLVVAGSAGFALALRASLARRVSAVKWPYWFDLHVLLRGASAVALFALTAGLAVSLWWSWQTVGVLTSSDSRTGWAAATWLIAAIGMLARRKGGRWGRWTAALAMLGAVVAILGLLAWIGSQRS
jgi:hypothetical protein